MVTTLTQRESIAQHLANFFAVVAQVAEQRVAEKKAAAEAKKQEKLTILGRAHFKATGAVLFGVEDRRGKEVARYHVTVIGGRVVGCTNATTGEECSGRRWSGHCCHETRVLSYELAREVQLADAAAIAPALLGESVASDLPAHIDDELHGQDVPVAVRDVEGETVHVLIDGSREVVMASDLPGLFPQGYRLVEKSDPDWQQEIARVIHFQKLDEMDEIDAERAAWARMSPDERRAAYSNRFDLSYGDAA